MEELIGNDAAAAYVDVLPKTWSAWVARKKAPEPDRREISHGHALPVWNRTTIDDWLANRPGRGRVRTADTDQAR